METQSTFDKLNNLVLIAEDSPTQAAKLRFMLENYGYTVIIGQDGKKALELALEHHPSLIISDIIMPEMNGYELCKALKLDERTSEIPVILLTSLSNSEDVLESLAYSADSFISKPYNEDFLISQIGKTMDGKNINKEHPGDIDLEISIGGKIRSIKSNPAKMLTLLISTYEAAMNKNSELIHSQEQLRMLNERLEDLVEERTAALSAEVKKHVKTQEELKNSFSLLEATLESTIDGILALDMQGRIIKYNRKFAELWNIPEVDLQTREDSKIINQILSQLKYPDQFLSKIQELYLDNFAESFDLIEFLDGRVFERYSRPQLVDKKVVGRVWSFWDITERMKAEQTLNILLTKYQVLFDTLPIGITITDDTGKIIESNKIAGTLLGISREEQEKRKIDGQEWRIIRPDGSLMPASEFASVRAFEEKRPVTDVEMGIVKENGKTAWINVSATPMPIDKYGVAIVYGDITERKQIENENARIQKLLIDSQRIGKIGGWELNIDTLELKWTREMYNINEVDLTFVPVVDKRVNFYTPETLPAIDNAIKQAIEQGGSFEIDSEIITAKGNRRSVKTIGKADLENRRVLGLFQDITERKKAEADLSLANEQLKELNATKDKFFSIIAHDLKSPFNSILGFSELLKDEARDLDIDSIVQYAGIIHSSALHTFELLDNLLDWSRMQQGRIPFEPKALLLNSIVNSEFVGLKNTADHKNISLIEGIHENIVVTADENMVSTVIRNLVSNAIKFTPKGGQVEVKVEVEDKDKDKDGQVIISVSDTGIGIKPETIGKLFKIETSFTTRGTENEKGTGLGLLLCKEFIEKHGGRIWVESEIGDSASGKTSGSKFFFTLPLNHNMII